MSEHITGFLEDLNGITAAEPRQRKEIIARTAWLRTADDDQLQQFLSSLLQYSVAYDDVKCALLSAAWEEMRTGRNAVAGAVAAWQPSNSLLDAIAALYRHQAAHGEPQGDLLRLLATAVGPRGLQHFADLVVEHPLRDAKAAATALSLLFQRRPNEVTPLFPRLLDGLVHPTMAAGILDLANFLTREQHIADHPAASRCEQLAMLLGGLVGRLGQLETAMPDDAEALAQITRQVEDGVALGIALCDALAQIGDSSVTGKLHQAMKLEHRRLRTEAAAALAQLGDDAGRDMLIQLASDRICRLRALAYADELGIQDRIATEYRTAESRAESELALWLAEPTQVGLPPSQCELVESRTLAWPGYDSPVECFLFRFVYDFGDQQLNNIAIAGPLTHAFPVDLGDLAPLDIYAAFAGWHARHEEIFEFDVEDITIHQRADVARLERRLRDSGYDAIQAVKLGGFFGEDALVVQAVREGRLGLAVATAQDVSWFPRSNSRQSLGPGEAYCIWKGRRLLRSFNAVEFDDDDRGV